MSTVGRELLMGIVAALKEEPALAAELRALFGMAAPDSTSTTGELFMRVSNYATRVSLSERTVWGLVARGLPTVGSGRTRRVDVERADAWLRSERGAIDDVVERSARLAARRAARAGK